MLNALLRSCFALLIVLLSPVALAKHAMTLEQAVRHSLEHHPQVLAAKASQLSTHFAINEVAGGYYPHVSVNMRRGYEASDNPFLRTQMRFGRETYRDENGINLNQMLWDWGRVKNEVKAERFNLRAADYRLVTSEQNIILRVAEAFYNVLRGRELVVLALNNIKVHKRTLEQVNLRFRGGAGTSGEVELARSRLALARIRLQDARGILKQSNAKFYALVGVIPPARLIRPRRIATFLPTSLRQAVASSVHRHPELSSRKAEVESRKASVNIAKSRMLPRFDVALNASSNTNVDGVLRRNRDFSALVSMNYDVFTGGSDLASIQRARSLELEAQHLYQQARRNIVENIATTWANYKTQRNIYLRQRQYVHYSKNVVADYKEQFKLGKRALFNVLDAENELFRARTGLTNAYYDALVEGYRLLANMGQLTPAAVKA